MDRICSRCGHKLPPSRKGQFCAETQRCHRRAQQRSEGPDFDIDVELSGEVAPTDREPSLPAEDTRESRLSHLVAWTRRAPLSLEELCDKLDLSPGKVRGLLDEAKRRHLAIQLKDGFVGIDRRPPEQVLETGVAPSGPIQRVACISDTHLGSKYCLRDYLKDFIHHAYERGVREILHSGDIIDGCYKFATYEWSHVGIEEQTRDLFETLPRLPGLSYHAIAGNHDYTYTDKAGVNVTAFISSYFRARGRDDFFGYGDRGAMLRIRGALVDLWHPSGNVAYAVSYKIQKRIEGYAPGFKPQILQIGHWHRVGHVEERGIFGFAAGTFQGYGSAFSRSLTNGPSTICGHILSWALTKDGTMRDLEFARRTYFENERPLDVGAIAR